MEMVDILISKLESNGNIYWLFHEDGRFSLPIMILSDDQLAKVIGDGQQVGSVDVVEQHRELVRAQVGNDATVAELLLQQPRDLDEHLIPGLEAVGIVDQLELIEVQPHARAVSAAGDGRSRPLS